MSDKIPSAVSDALNSLTTACRAWPQPAFEKLPQGLPKLPPNDTMNAVTACNGLLHPHQEDTLILVMMGLSVIGLVALAWCGMSLCFWIWDIAVFSMNERKLSRLKNEA